eukprot:Nk52_evm1s610 gene=Nk52_evmTU1s610
MLAIVTKNLHVQPCRMTFGHVNAPVWFGLQMTRLLDKIENAFVYIDDIIVASESLAQHKEDLARVFAKLEEAQLTLNPRKMKPGYQTVKVFGMVFNGEGVQADVERVQGILDAEAPRTVRAVRRFLGAVGYYREFFPHFSDHTTPITNLLKTGVKFEWGPEQQQAVTKLKNVLADKVMLYHPDWDKPFFLETDASDHAMGCLVYQLTEDGKTRLPVSFSSRTFTHAERNYSVMEKEILGALWGITKNVHYLYGSHFTLYTDNTALSHFLNFKVNDLTGRRIRSS